jgi:hypothetical protein
VDWRRNSRRSDDRRPPVGSTSTPDASVRRYRTSHRPTRPGRVGSASPLLFFEGEVPFIRRQGLRSGEGCALRERGPLGRDIATDACVRSDCPAQRSPAVVRRPGPRHVLESPTRPSASICVICGFLRWVSRSVLSGSSVGRLRWVGGSVCSLCLRGCSSGSWSWCLRVFVFATWWEGRSFRVSHSSSFSAPCASPPAALSSSV